MVGQVVPEPSDVRTEHAMDAGALIFDNPITHGLDSSTDSRSSGKVVTFLSLNRAHVKQQQQKVCITILILLVYMQFMHMLWFYSSLCRWK